MQIQNCFTKLLLGVRWGDMFIMNMKGKIPGLQVGL